MAEHKAFTKKHAEAVAQDNRAILEEMNLPPAVIEYIRKNGKTIQIVIAVAVVAILGWEGYGKYTATQRDRSADLLYQAMRAETPDARLAGLKELNAKYDSHGSGLWGLIEQGHIAFKAGKFQEAVTLYESVIKSAGTTSPLFPLVQYNLALAYENLPDQAKAKSAYQKLAEVKGFAGEAALGLAHIAELEGKSDEARAKYQEFVDLPETKDGPTKDWAKDKVQTLTPKKGK